MCCAWARIAFQLGLPFLAAAAWLGIFAGRSSLFSASTDSIGGPKRSTLRYLFDVPELGILVPCDFLWGISLTALYHEITSPRGPAHPFGPMKSGWHLMPNLRLGAYCESKGPPMATVTKGFTHMRRVLVPLDGSEFALSIIPDARKYAGSNGTLVLIRDVPVLANAFVGFDSRAAVYAEEAGVETARHYLEEQADILREQGVDVEVATYSGIAASAIDESAGDFHVDLIALATHARHGLGRMIWGSVGWQALVHSPVPVLFRHDGHRGPRSLPRILVPVDGSELAEQALSITRDLMAEWQASLYIVQVIKHRDASSEEIDRVRSYLDRVGGDIRGNVHTAILRGDVVEAIAKVADEWSITDVVTTSHGRTGLSRVILGSVADGLIRRLSLPVLVVPALAARLEKERQIQSRVLQFSR